MKTVQQFWHELVSLTSPWGLSNQRQREIQSLVLSGIEALPVLDSGFSFGAASLREMQGVDGTLVRVATLALKYSLQDFCVYDGIRTRTEQAQHVRLGTSKTMESKHLDGLALDLVPWINGKPVWDWDGCINVALAMIRAAHELKVAHRITWGGLWDRKLSDLDWRTVDLPKELADYRARHAGPDFLDGPHFEITRS